MRSSIDFSFALFFGYTFFLGVAYCKSYKYRFTLPLYKSDKNKRRRRRILPGASTMKEERTRRRREAGRLLPTGSISSRSPPIRTSCWSASCASFFPSLSSRDLSPLSLSSHPKCTTPFGWASLASKRFCEMGTDDRKLESNTTDPPDRTEIEWQPAGESTFLGFRGVALRSGIVFTSPTPNQDRLGFGPGEERD